MPKRYSLHSTPINVDEGYDGQISRYARYSFFVILLIFLLLLAGMGYIFCKGIPAKMAI